METPKGYCCRQYASFWNAFLFSRVSDSFRNGYAWLPFMGPHPDPGSAYIDAIFSVSDYFSPFGV